MKGRLLILRAILVPVILAGLFGCGSGPDLVGNYERIDSPKDFLELRDDGTGSAITWDGKRYPVVWTVENDIVVLSIGDGPDQETVRMGIKGKTLIVDGGPTFLKR